MILVEFVISAIVAVSTRGECYPADQYPTDVSEITGYVVIDNCSIPTTAESIRALAIVLGSK